MRGVYLLVGAALLAVGVLGYFQNPILGVITSNPYHNLLHVGSGLATLDFVSSACRTSLRLRALHRDSAISAWAATPGTQTRPSTTMGMSRVANRRRMRILTLRCTTRSGSDRSCGA